MAAEARDLATPRQLGSQPNLDNLLRAAHGDPPDTPAGGQQVDIESSMAAMKAAAAESDAACTCVQRTGVLHTHSRTHGAAVARVPARVRRTARQERLLTHHTLHTQGLCCRMQPQHAPHGSPERQREHGRGCQSHCQPARTQRARDRAADSPIASLLRRHHVCERLCQGALCCMAPWAGQCLQPPQAPSLGTDARACADTGGSFGWLSGGAAQVRRRTSATDSI